MHDSLVYSDEGLDGGAGGTGGFARAVAFDMPGLGHADDRLGGPYSTEGAAHFIDSTLAQLGINRADHGRRLSDDARSRADSFSA
jgi:pimeloyl-ACP methyl ester carboxylesterase